MTGADSDSGDLGLRDAVRYLGRLHGAIRRPVIGLVAAGTASGLAEAVALLAFVRAAVSITADDAASITVPGLDVEMSPGSLLWVAFAAGVLSGILHVQLARGAAKLSFHVGDSARRRLIDGFLNAQWAHIATYREGRLQEAISRLTEGTTRAASHLALGMSSVIILIALGVAAIATSPVVSLSLMAIPTLGLIIAGPNLRALRVRSRRDTDEARGLSEEIAETTTLARDYRAFGVQRQRAAELQRVSTEYGQNATRTRLVAFALVFLFKDITVLALIGIVGLLYLTSDLQEGAVIASVLLIIRMLGYLQQTVRMLQEGAHDAAAIGALKDAIDDLDRAVEPRGNTRLDDVGTIRFEGVGYSYGPERQALDEVDLEIEPNTTVGLVGQSGSGKSTLADLLLGLRHPQRGTITIGDVDLSDIDRGSWTRQTALVPQDQHLAGASIHENIVFLRDGLSRADAIAAAKAAHVHEEILALPGGYDYVIGSRSQGLSGGQRQRIAIARALAGRPSVLVLDEPTSALDASTEALIRTTLDELHGRMTIIAIAHRPATLEACDLVVRLADGRVIDVAAGPRASAPS